ncbi:MAG: chloride channel protein [Candidatus Margulisiibacteriota bacterium]
MGNKLPPVVTFGAKWGLFGLLVGLPTGVLTYLFMAALLRVTTFRMDHPWMVFGLPLAGLILALCFRYFGKGTESAGTLVFDAIHHDPKLLPKRLIPFVFGGCLLTHASGGSAGREGVAIQMGAGLAEQFGKLFRLSHKDRRILLLSGMAAGFSGLFGTPLTAVIFALEVSTIGQIEISALLPALVASVSAFMVSAALGTAHLHFPALDIPDLSFHALSGVGIASLCFGILAFAFTFGLSTFEKKWVEWIRRPLLRPVLGGAVIVAGWWVLHTDLYLGLGVDVIGQAFQEDLPLHTFFGKMLFTIVTLGSGFKGGEVTPLFYIGATLGNALAPLLNLPFTFLAGLGFVAVFAGCTNTPLACTIMAMELFGTEMGLYAALACVIAYLISGQKGVYHAQRGQKPFL